MSYGIGRLTAETNPVDEALAELEAERIQPIPRTKRPTVRCRRCGMEGAAGSYPFSTCAGFGLCDDCGE